jgi:nicotinamidase/pyrazinamidase
MAKLPEYYGQRDAYKFYLPRLETAYKAGQAARVGQDVFGHRRRGTNNALLLIDPQVDFICDGGTLQVAGAMQDSARTAEFIYNNLWDIDNLYVSLDTHKPFQIFFSSWWENNEGMPPPPFTVITAEDVQDGVWLPRSLPRWSRKYVEELAKTGRYQLIIWPQHCLQGTSGNAVAPVLAEAIEFWAAAHEISATYIVKGLAAETENYSVFEPEVKTDNYADELNQKTLNELAAFDRIFVAGQAKSHCVLSTLESMVKYYSKEYHPFFSNRLHVLTDCMSSVVSPAVDFEAIANAALEKMHRLNQITLTNSTVSLD